MPAASGHHKHHLPVLHVTIRTRFELLGCSHDLCWCDACRACVRTHKLALAAQRRFWHTIIRDTVQFAEVQRALDLLDRAEKQATQVYKR
jgi:hypothetical protein